jgi:flagellar hook protein FlgE
MSDALLSGVSGLQAHQTMLDVAGNNLANVNTFAFKSSRVTFGELLAETMREATQPTATAGGTNPQQVGSGVKVSSVDRNMNQGNLVITGQQLDMAIEGAGYFVLGDGTRDVYTRVGAFAVDANFYLVDPGTGFRVQRIGSEGVAEGFQAASSDNIRIPYDMALAAKPTENITFSGNLSADAIKPTTNLLSSGTQYTADGAIAATTNLLTDLDQAAGVVAGDTISISGMDRTGNAVTSTFTIAAASTVADLLGAINAVFPGSTATLSNGEIRLQDDEAGYSRTDLNLTYSGAGEFDLPNYFKLLSVGGEEVRDTNIEVFDSLGIGHILSAAFVRTNTANTWDCVLTNATGDVFLDDRRVCGLTFNADGSYGGLDAVSGDTATFGLRYGSTGSMADIALDFGTVGSFDGLSQLGGGSTVSANGQDGYEAGYLSSLSVSHDGVLVGMFTNGVRQNIAALKLATFQNAAGLEGIGGGMFIASANSGNPLPTKAQNGGAGSVNGGSLEKSNVDMASEFVSLIQAQNGYQANARTIRVTNDMLRELATLIR